MAMKLRVTNVAGRVVALKSVSTRLTPLFDAQGNTLALYSNTGGLQDSYKYFPYGEIRISTGSHNNPFRYGGRWGYFYDSPARTYVRRRVLKTVTGSWMTRDPIWPWEQSYVYAKSKPVSHFDPSILGGDNCKGAKVTYPSKVNWTSDCGDTRDCEEIAKALQSICKKMNANVTDCIHNNCQDASNPFDTETCITDICSGRRKLSFNCVGRFSQGNCKPNDCAATQNGVISLCWRPSWPNDAEECDYGCTLLHEMIHVCGSSHYVVPSAILKTAKRTDRWIPASMKADCTCFTCTSFLPGCEHFHSYREWSKRLIAHPNDCNSVPLESACTNQAS